MRVALGAAVVAILAIPPSLRPQSSAPFVPIGVWYGGGTTRAPMVSRNPAPEREAWRRDLAAIHSLGFNSIKTWVDWASAEPDRGRYRFDALDQLLTLADEVGLKVIVQIYTAAARAASHASFYGIDVWSEPHIVNWVWFNTPAEFCYCPHTQARFRDWLKRKYRTVDAVNSAWYRTFSSWDEVEAPRFGTILSYTDFIDWKTFIAAKLEEDL